MKSRLDILLVERGLVVSREKAKALIMAGEVLVDDVPVSKAGQLVNQASEVRLRNIAQKYVSRGGDKLEGALLDFSIETQGLVCLDIGSSTGGFSDCLLQRGACKVYCVDVGTNQLDHKLRVDSRIEVYEKTHVRNISSINFDPKPEFVVIDVSFIGLLKVLPYIVPLLGSSNFILMLVKPQFELGPELISKGGVPKEGIDPYLAVKELISNLESIGLEYSGDVPCRIKGKKSENQEYFLLTKVV